MLTAEMIEQMAMTINGPHDATHIGTKKLNELQKVRWQRQTTEGDKNICRLQARAALESMSADSARYKEALYNIAHKSGAADDLGWCQRIAKEALYEK